LVQGKLNLVYENFEHKYGMSEQCPVEKQGENLVKASS